MLRRKRTKGIAILKQLEELAVISEAPSNRMFILPYCNSTEDDYRVIEEALSKHGDLKTFVLMPGVNYGFVEYNTVHEAEEAYNFANPPANCRRELGAILEFDPKPHMVTLLYTKNRFEELNLGKSALCCFSVPRVQGRDLGIELHKEFIKPEEEQRIVEMLDANNGKEWIPLAHRRVQHFGYEFIYGANSADRERLANSPIPDWGNKLLDVLEKLIGMRFDQLTVNDYQPGDSIPPHIDAAEPFEEPILALSLLSGIGMNFRRDSPSSVSNSQQLCDIGTVEEEEEFSLYLPRASLLVMRGEGRYEWKHAICQRKFDVIGNKTKYRDRRISITFRKLKGLNDN
eukprot:Nk52_evm48s745 gene=Nk52_evmTU48s745